MARFMGRKAINPKLKQSETAKQLGCSNSTLQRYRQVINTVSPYRIPPNSHKRERNFKI